MVGVGRPGASGAARFHAGQLAILGDRSPASRAVARMAQQEERHRIFFDAMMARRGVRPTLLQPLWNVAGFALGAVTAAIGPEAAMACTAAVETEIDKHYSDQLHALGVSDTELSAAVADFQAEEGADEGQDQDDENDCAEVHFELLLRMSERQRRIWPSPRLSRPEAELISMLRQNAKTLKFRF
eukprot:gene42734-57851_t